MSGPPVGWFDRWSNARERLGFVADLLAVLAFLGVGSLAALIGLLWGSGGVAAPAAPSATSVAIAPPPTVAGTPTEPTASATTSEPAPSDTPPARVVLAEDESLGVATGDDLRFETVSIDGHQLPDSLHFHCETFCNGAGRAVYQVNLGRHFRQLSFTPGITDTGPDGVGAHFEAEVDGNVRYDKTLTLGQPARETVVDVSNGLRLTLRITWSARVPSPVEIGAGLAGGADSPKLPDAAWGRPILLR